jgi:hypothetical protein
MRRLPTSVCNLGRNLKEDVVVDVPRRSLSHDVWWYVCASGVFEVRNGRCRTLFGEELRVMVEEL